MLKMVKKLMVCCFFLLQTVVLPAEHANASKEIEAGGSVSVNDTELNIDVSDSGGTGKNQFHYGYFFKADGGVGSKTSVTFVNDFTLNGQVSCNQNHKVFGFRIGSDESVQENTSLGFKAKDMTINFEQTNGSDVFGFAFMNNSHDNDNPLVNTVSVDDLFIKFSNGVQADRYAAGLYFFKALDQYL